VAGTRPGQARLPGAHGRHLETPRREEPQVYEILLMGILTVYKEGVRKYHRGKTAFF
jgi:hypothetical protein